MKKIKIMVAVATFVLAMLNLQIGVSSDGGSFTDMFSLGQQASAASKASEAGVCYMYYYGSCMPAPYGNCYCGY